MARKNEISRLRQQQSAKLRTAMGTAEKGSPRQEVKNLKKMQGMLVGGAYGGKKEHRRRLQTYHKKRMKKRYKMRFGVEPKSEKTKKKKLKKRFRKNK